MDAMIDLILPQLATLTDQPPEEEWLHEIKYDGYRLLCRKDGGRIKLFTRRGHNWSMKFPAIIEAVSGIDADTAWLDGELVVMLEEGRSCFRVAVGSSVAEDQGCMAYYVFDVLYLGSGCCGGGRGGGVESAVYRLCGGVWARVFLGGVRAADGGDSEQAGGVAVLSCAALDRLGKEQMSGAQRGARTGSWENWR